ncbi:MAG: hypothetical protein K8T10_16155 [Candidatus Eremiobacteraeota bacterium]|nr:hypothetical protein [Candidatus Eremiobacteraeota bacterium]
MDNKEAKRACGHLQFLKLLLSMGAHDTNSIFDSKRHANQRIIKYNLNICIDEEYYQLCLELGLQNLINKTQILNAKNADPE